ncbi:hypothetical protein BY996DRAFT_8550301 [Phakopsora pachyrhizi]|nr:hypothetical protein BY996DRAFT_8550301 [Phakopsora pachyrhizi]
MTVEILKAKKEENKSLETHYELADTVYTRAIIEPPKKKFHQTTIPEREKEKGGKTEYLAGVGDSLALVVIRAFSTVLSYWPVTIPNWNCSKQFILDLIYKKILPLELTVKKNYFNVDEIKTDVYIFLGVDQSRVLICKDTINQKLKAESRRALKDSRTMTRRDGYKGINKLFGTVLQPTQTKHKKVLSILGEGAKARPDQLEDSINDPNNWFSTRILNLTSSKGVRIQLKCVGCGQTILSLGEPNQSIRWFALPSEDWQGFIEYWICHDENDQHQSDGSGKIRDPKEYKGFIGDFDLRFDRAWIKSRHSERGWKFTRQESDGDCVEEDEVLNGERSEKGQEKIIPTILERGGGVDLKTRLECKSCLSDYTRELWSSRLTERMRIGSNTRQRKTYTTKNLFEEDWPKHREMVLKEMEYLNLVKGIHKFLMCDEDSVQVQLAFAVKISKTKESERRRTIEEEFIKVLEGSRIRYLIEDDHDEGKL